MWMSEPMPVTTRIITADSGSSASWKSALKLPDETQVKTVCTTRRSSGTRPSIDQTAASDTRKDRIIAPHAAAEATPFPLRRPPKALIRNPTNANSGISGSIAAPLRPLSTSAPVSPFQLGERVGVERLAVTEQADDDGKAHRRFRGGDRHDEEHDDLAVRAAVHAAERDEREIDGVQHDLDRQQNRDQVAAHEHACRADAEQHGRQHEILLERRRRHCPPSFRASTTAPTIATRISTDVTSNANA